MLAESGQPKNARSHVTWLTRKTCGITTDHIQPTSISMNTSTRTITVRMGHCHYPHRRIILASSNAL